MAVKNWCGSVIDGSIPDAVDHFDEANRQVRTYQYS
jgi:hypothetical protein